MHMSLTSLSLVVSPAAGPSPSRGLDASRVVVPLLPDLRVGRVWAETVSDYALRFGVLPQVFRVLRVDASRVVVVELQTDAAGYGQVRIAGELRVSELAGCLPSLAGRFGRVIIDDALWDAAGVSDEQGASRYARASEVHAELEAGSNLVLGPDAATWNRRLVEGVSASRSLPVRGALERVRVEMIAWLEQLLLSA